MKKVTGIGGSFLSVKTQRKLLNGIILIWVLMPNRTA